MAKNEVAVKEDFNLVTMYDGMDDELKEELLEEMGEIEGGGGIDCRRITVGANTKAFKVESDTQGDPDFEKELKGVILFTHASNCKWAGDYQEGEYNKPECASLDGKQGVVFETGEARDCERCPYNQFVPDDTGKSRKACRNTRRIYLMLEGKPQLYLLQVPPTSLKSVRDNMRRLMSGGLPISRQVVSFKINDTFRITIDKAADLTAEQCALVKEMRNQIKSQYESATVTTDAYFAKDEDDTAPAPSAMDGFMGQASQTDGFVDVPDAISEELPFN